MKILHMMPYSPIPPQYGGALRVYHMLKNVSRSHEVSVFTYGTREVETELRKEFGKAVKDVFLVPRPWTRRYRRTGQLYSLFTKHSNFHSLMVNEDVQREVDHILASHDFDLILSEFSTMGQIHLKSDAAKILDTHNVEYDLFKRLWEKSKTPLRKLHYYYEYKRFKEEEIDACRRQDAVLVTSARDKEIFDADVPEIPKYIIPNGVDAAYFRPSTDAQEPTSIVFTGLMGYVPNSDGILYFLDEIFPLIQRKIPNVKIYIVGNRPPKPLMKRASSNIIVTGYVDDVRPYVWRSSVYVVPLRMGGGTRLKVLEAMAMKKAIVTTSIGCEGIDVVNRETAFVEDEPQSFADAVVELLHSPALRNRLIQNSYELMRSRYEWSVIGQQAEEVYQSFVQESKSKTNVAVS